MWRFLHGLYPHFREPLLDSGGNPVEYAGVGPIQPDSETGRAGAVVTAPYGWCLRCRDGSIQLLARPQLPGKAEGAIKTEIIAAGLFVAFAALSLVAALSQSRAEEARRRAVSLFLAFTLVALVSPGFLRREAWPFSRWQLFAYHYRPPVENIEIRGVDGHGVEWAIDRRAWEPLSSLELFTWAQKNWRQLAAKDQAIAGKYLLNLVNRNRAVAASGHRPGVFGRYFGPLAAPLHVVYRPIWDNPSAVPPAPFVVLRIYNNVWDVERRDRDPKDSRRELMYEGPRPEGDEDKR